MWIEQVKFKSTGCNTACSQLLAAPWAVSLQRKIKHSAVEGKDYVLKGRLKSVSVYVLLNLQDLCEVKKQGK